MYKQGAMKCNVAAGNFSRPGAGDFFGHLARDYESAHTYALERTHPWLLHSLLGPLVFVYTQLREQIRTGRQMLTPFSRKQYALLRIKGVGRPRAKARSSPFAPLYAFGRQDLLRVRGRGVRTHVSRGVISARAHAFSLPCTPSAKATAGLVRRSRVVLGRLTSRSRTGARGTSIPPRAHAWTRSSAAGKNVCWPFVTQQKAAMAAQAPVDTEAFRAGLAEALALRDIVMQFREAEIPQVRRFMKNTSTNDYCARLTPSPCFLLPCSPQDTLALIQDFNNGWCSLLESDNFQDITVHGTLREFLVGDTMGTLMTSMGDLVLFYSSMDTEPDSDTDTDLIAAALQVLSFCHHAGSQVRDLSVVWAGALPKFDHQRVYVHSCQLCRARPLPR